MRRVRFGVIGAGGIAYRRAIPALLESCSCELSAVMEVVNAEALGQKYGVSFYDRVGEQMPVHKLAARGAFHFGGGFKPEREASA